MAWQKRARLVAVLVAVGVGATVLITTRRREPPPAPRPVSRVDPAAVVESSGAIVRQVKGERENFRLEADKQLSYPDGTSKLLGVKITIDRQGKTYVVTGSEAKAGDNQSHIELTGNVHLSSSDGLDVTAGSATYSEGEGIVRAPGPVTFKRGRMNGTGVGFTYDKNLDQIALEDKAAITFAPDEAESQTTEITAGSAILGRRDKFASFERAVHIVRADQVIDAASAVADLAEDEKHITALELMGGARIMTPQAAPGELSEMAGDAISLSYVPNSELLERAVILGSSTLRFSGVKGSPGRTLTATSVEIGLAPDGKTVTSLNAREQVVVDLPGARGEAAKSIRSASLVGTGNTQSGITGVVFTDNVEYRETGGTPAVKRVVTSRTLNAITDGGFGEIRDARFAGTTRFRDGATQATAANMRYQVAAGQVDLSGNVGNALPQVADERIVVNAENIEMMLAGPMLKAAGEVSTLLKPTKAGGSAPSKTRMPGLMQQDQQANGRSAKLAYNGETSVIDLTGSARLWQGDTRIDAETIHVDGATGNLSASGGVRSIIMVRDTNATTKVRETSRATTSAESMLYEDGPRMATYTTDANLTGPQGNLKGGVIALTLGTNGQDIERIEATGNVTFREQDRITTGERLTYAAAAEEYTVAGSKDKLVQMIRRTDEGCRESSGNVLTFARATDSLRIEGKEVSRTQTKTVSCSGLPRIN
jgi:LPS export ABC transporter protein LptC